MSAMIKFHVMQAINPSTANTALFNLTVTFDANNHTLPATEVEGITTIYQRYS